MLPVKFTYEPEPLLVSDFRIGAINGVDELRTQFSPEKSPGQ